MCLNTVDSLESHSGVCWDTCAHIRQNEDNCVKVQYESVTENILLSFHS